MPVPASAIPRAVPRAATNQPAMPRDQVSGVVPMPNTASRNQLARQSVGLPFWQASSTKPAASPIWLAIATLRTPKRSIIEPAIPATHTVPNIAKRSPDCTTARGQPKACASGLAKTPSV